MVKDWETPAVVVKLHYVIIIVCSWYWFLLVLVAVWCIIGGPWSFLPARETTRHFPLFRWLWLKLCLAGRVVFVFRFGFLFRARMHTHTHTYTLHSLSCSEGLRWRLILLRVVCYNSFSVDLGLSLASRGSAKGYGVRGGIGWLVERKRERVESRKRGLLHLREFWAWRFQKRPWKSE